MMITCYDREGGSCDAGGLPASGVRAFELAFAATEGAPRAIIALRAALRCISLVSVPVSSADWLRCRAGGGRGGAPQL
jgi:hypothetical protein